LGALLIASFFSTNINPDVAAANFDILALVPGGLILGADFLGKKRALFQMYTAGSPTLVTFSWTIFFCRFTDKSPRVSARESSYVYLPCDGQL
jgi:hypothetical protein